MSTHLNRRKFITSIGALTAALPLGASAFDFIPSPGKSFNFLLLGDLHFDKLAHHNMDYVKAKYPNDMVQIEYYSQVTSENLPVLMQVARDKGLQFYNEDLVNLEPDFSPATLQERRNNLTNEKPFIRHFEYADFMGYSSLSVSAKNEIEMSIYANVDTEPWKVINVSELLKA